MTDQKRLKALQRAVQHATKADPKGSAQRALEMAATARLEPLPPLADAADALSVVALLAESDPIALEAVAVLRRAVAHAYRDDNAQRQAKWRQVQETVAAVREIVGTGAACALVDQGPELPPGLAFTVAASRRAEHFEAEIKGVPVWVRFVRKRDKASKKANTKCLNNTD